ncbi:MAG: SpoIIE family protein phosphatase [Chloroflexi bacterium]|nr:SpoIIE family protein phosphatase [Chloroflexota bacterium]
MKSITQTRTTWINFLPSGVVTLAATAVIVLAPFYAIQWYRSPFLGMLLEPNMVVANMDATDWPAMDAGVQYPDRLISAGGTSVQTIAALQDMLTENEFEPITLTFEHQDDSLPYTVTVTPRTPIPSEFLRLFIIPYSVGLAFLLTGLWAFRLDTSNHPVRVFLMFAASTSLSTSALFDLNTTHNLALLWVLSLPMAAGSLAQLALVFPRKVGFVKRYIFLRFLPWIPAIAVAVPGMLEYLNPTTPWAYISTWLNNYTFAGIVILIFISIQLWRAIYDNEPVVRQQSRIIVFGAALAFGPIFILFFLPVALGFVQPFRAEVLIPPLLIFPLSVAYAIVRYRLLDIDRLLSNSLNYGLTTTGAIGLFYLLITTLSLAVGDKLNADDPFIVAIFLLLMVVILNPIRNLAQSAIDRVFYRTRADYRYVLNTLSHNLGFTANLNQVLKLLEEVIDEAFKPESFVLYLFDDDKTLYIPHSNQPHSEFPLDPEIKLIHTLKENPKPIWLPPESKWLEDRDAQPGTGEIPNYQVFIPLQYQDDLIGLLALGPRLSGMPYSSDDLDFLDTVASQSSLSFENARLQQINISRLRLEDELEVSRKIQMSMLPKSVPAIPGWEFAAYYQPARDVGGDFYDFFKLSGNTDDWGLVIGDVVDKGIPAALYMASCRTMIRTAVISGGSPSEALMQANEYIINDIQSNLFLTVFYAILKPKEGRLTFSNAGHSRPLWIHSESSEVDEITTPGIILGYFENIELEQQEIYVAPGDFLVFFTDGLTDASNEKKQSFDDHRLRSTVVADLEVSAKDMLDSVVEAVQNHIGEVAQTDDLTIFVVKRENSA